MAWMDDEIKRIKAKDAQQAENNQLQLHKTEVLRAKASLLFSQLMEELARNIDQFNQAFADDSKRRRHIEIVDNQGHVRLSGGRREVLFSLDDSYQAIKYEPSGVGVAGGPPKTIELMVDEGDNVGFREGTTASVAQRLLGTITSDMTDN